MAKSKTSKEAYDLCGQDGLFIPQQSIDKKKITAMVALAIADLEQAHRLTLATPKESTGWSTVYKLYYDVLRCLVDALLLFDKVKSSNHQCAFAYICEKHDNLELDWNFLEKVRTKRNGIQYYGTPVNHKDWKEIELQINIYINTLKKAIEPKIKQSN